jgi:hypothetical protein
MLAFTLVVMTESSTYSPVLSLVGVDAQPTMVKATVAVKMAVATRLVMFMMNSLLLMMLQVELRRAGCGERIRVKLYFAKFGFGEATHWSLAAPAKASQRSPGDLPGRVQFVLARLVARFDGLAVGLGVGLGRTSRLGLRLQTSFSLPVKPAQRTLSRS